MIVGLSAAAVAVVPALAQSKTEKERNQTTAVDKGYPGRDADLEKQGTQLPANNGSSLDDNKGSNTITGNHFAPVGTEKKPVSNKKVK